MNQTEQILREALRLLREIHPGNMTPMAEESWKNAIVLIEQVLASEPAPAVAVNEHIGVIKRYGYQALFNAIAEATKISEGGYIGVSVLDFAKSLDAAIAAAEAAKGGV